MEIAVIGTGYVGLVASVCFADAGHIVNCVDTDTKKIGLLKDGVVPFYEPGLEDLLKRSIRAHRISFSTSLEMVAKSSSVIFVAVGTPEAADGSTDMTATMKVIEQISKDVKSPKIVVMKSTVPVGTAQRVETYFAQNSLAQHEIVSNPEFLKEGAAVDDFLRPDRVIIGCKTENVKTVMSELYAPFVKNGNPILFMDNVSAELTKYAANSFLATKISFINELAALADAMGADIEKVKAGFTSDSRINPAFFYPGVGYGGSCFPKDVKSYVHMGQSAGLPMHLSQATEKVNQEQIHRFYQKIETHYEGALKGKVFAIWGLSFKPRTDDMREAPSIALIRKLIDAGAKVKAFDPVAMENAKSVLPPQVQFFDSADECILNTDALVVVTEWNEFRNPNFSSLKKNLKDAVVFDGRNVYDPTTMKKQGLKYYCVGRQSLMKDSGL